MLRTLGALLWALTLLLAQAEGKYRDHPRYKRQLGEHSSPPIDLNSTVPYIFSARLYPFGESKGDRILTEDQLPFPLLEPFQFLGSVYDTIFIRADGAVSLSGVSQQPSALPSQHPIIATYWMPVRGGRVFYRQTEDASVLNLAHNEVNIQYRYGQIFNIRSVVIVTWDGVRDANSPDSEGNVFQLALLIGDQMTFAHMIYSKLNTNHDAVAGFSNGLSLSYSLPDSSTPDAIHLSEKSDIGIPGEWLFRIDTPRIFLCGAGFKGLECVESCSPSQWFNDCSRSCHCENGDQCDPETGRCPTGRCSPGWTSEPICEKDINECDRADVCPNETPDCVNTPGAFMCLCFEYDENTKSCKGSKPASAPSEAVPVEVVPLRPQMKAFSQPPTTQVPKGRGRFASTTTVESTTTQEVTSTTTPSTTTTPRTTTPMHTIAPKNLPTEVVGRVIQPSLPNLAPSCSGCSPFATCHAGRCECEKGFKGDGVNCMDVDECEDKRTCGEHASCENTIGGHECTCDIGYKYVGGVCVDKNECAEGNPCGEAPAVECVNSEGSFACACKDGYEGDPRSAQGCRDIDECAVSEVFCGKHASCTNQIGGFECECLEGFERLTEDSFCTDIDECLLNPCHPAAVCSNLMGSFTCQCIEGFIGNGVQCHETILYPIANDSFVVPRTNNAIATFHLHSPVSAFGKQYENVHVSSNGLVSFAPLPAALLSDPLSLAAPAIFALHSQYDYENEGLVAYTHINESDAASYALLTRSSLSIQNQFKLGDFRTKDLHVFTFDRMRQAGTDNVNSFQVVISSSPPLTLLTLLYEKAEAKGTLVGVKDNAEFHELPADTLTTQTNVGQPGKWMMRVDGERIGACPAGTINPPFCNQACPTGRWGLSCAEECHCASGVSCDMASGVCVTGSCQPGFKGPNCDEDINECATGIVTCHSNATCQNTRGSFECVCRKGFSGDGKTCTAVGRCESRFGRPCHAHAGCVEVNREPVCQCLLGYVGDGLTCQPLVKASPLPPANAVSPSGNGKVVIPTLQNGIETPNAPQPLPTSVDQPVHDEKPFVMTNWVTEPTPTTTQRQPNKAVLFNSGKKQPVPVHSSDFSENSSELDTNHVVVEEKREGDDDSSDAATLLMILAPAALIGVWFILIVAVIAICCRKKSRRQDRRSPAVESPWQFTQRGVAQQPPPPPQPIYGLTTRHFV